MYGLAMITAADALRLASERQAELRAEADRYRLARESNDRPNGHSIAAAIRSFRAAFRAVDEFQPGVPALTDYPYRS
ncbi:MAG TPA: hypothetical protein VGC90_08550 [Candidatus Limnocylindrales bacterium]